MYTVRVETDFAAAHFLSHYHGKCENLHGHNYRVRLFAQGGTLDEGGMLVDFGVLKNALKTVIEGLDHTNLNDNPFFLGDPSAERIAHFIFSNVENELKDKGVNSSLLNAVEVFETHTNMARYQRD
ncbi:MAG: 6-carboxytetrahydropterin synthase QueD [Termitinemataceae bacterium]|nr:MAG: 6-carboxytetrahydropterin synthase QueD [Termitinemataceae bacterium]